MAIVEEVRAAHQLPAMAAIVFKDDRVVEEAVTGVRKSGDDTPAKIGDKWHLGSLTKSMTASLAAICVQEKKINWDTTLGSQFKNIHADFMPVTLQQLLEHRGGISHDGPKDIWQKFTRRSGPVKQNRQWWVDRILAQPPDQEVGKFQYSNPGIVIAGNLLEKAGDRSWETLIQEKLFKPLGMTGAGFGMPGKSLDKPDQPWGHAANDLPIPPSIGADNPPGLGPAGTVHMTLADLATYGRWHLSDGKSKPGILDEAAFKTLHTPRFPDAKGEGYECGWSVVARQWAGGMALTHNGTNTMNYAVIWLAPSKKFGFAVVTNKGGDDAGKATDEVAGKIVGKFSNE